VNDYGDYRELGRTRDDAAGEAYDKVAKLLGFSYPGGPVIDSLASKGDSEAIIFPKSKLKGSFDFSFSGLKTSVLNYVRKNPNASKENVAASFQRAVIEVLTERIVEVVKSERIPRVALSGGVSANSSLRERMGQTLSAHGAEIFLPSLSLCTDNAAMIAAAGYHHYKKGNRASFSLNPKAYLPLGLANG
jgi:N6-L-threonylcarbamoyladenine synthase